MGSLLQKNTVSTFKAILEHEGRPRLGGEVLYSDAGDATAQFRSRFRHAQLAVRWVRTDEVVTRCQLEGCHEILHKMCHVWPSPLLWIGEHASMFFLQHNSHQHKGNDKRNLLGDIKAASYPVDRK